MSIADYVYLDYNATTPMVPEVHEAMGPFLRDQFGNPSSLHALGRQARDALLDSRDEVAGWIGCRPTELFFTSGGTEADNLALLGVTRSRDSRRRGVVTSVIEHHAVLHPARELVRQDFESSEVPVLASGRVDVDSLREMVSERTLLVSIMHANNETGVIQPIEEISDIVHEAGAYLHTDAVQSCGKIPVNVNQLGVDLLSLSAHKFYGPKGVGALFVRRGTPFSPVYRGGSQERSRRPGTENLAGIVGLARAATLAAERLTAERDRLAPLRDRLEDTLLQEIGGARSAGREVPRTPNTLNIHCEGIDGEELVIALDRAGFAVSTGAACSAGSAEPSHVLKAMHLTPDEVQSSIRVSLGRGSTADGVDRFARVMIESVAKLRAELVQN